MKKKSTAAFTLIEIVAAMTVILVLTGIVISIASLVFSKANRTRAAAERDELEVAITSYKAETGAYPQDLQPDLASEGVTDKLKPKLHFIPTEKVYEDANLYLYKELSG